MEDFGKKDTTGEEKPPIDERSSSSLEKVTTLPEQRKEIDPNIGKVESGAARDTRLYYLRECFKKPYEEQINDESFKMAFQRHIFLYPVETANNGLVQYYESLFKEKKLPSSESTEAFKLAKELSLKYGVMVEIVKTNADYYSDSTIERTVTTGVYFISEEASIITAQSTELLIKHNRMKQSLSKKSDQTRAQDHVDLLGVANEKLSEKVKQTSLRLGKEIENIKKTYQTQHNGEEPNLSKVASILNERQIDSPSGKPKKWVAETVKRVIKRYNSLPDK